MGLGKTVMTIALILSNPGREKSQRNKRGNVDTPYGVEGGTLIVCPMALLGQWKVCFPCVYPNGKNHDCSFVSLKLCFITER